MPVRTEPDRLVDVLVLSPLSVRPDAQRRAVGRVLVQESLERLEGVRGRLVYPDVFWRHDSVGLRD
jgi:predicted N-acetyltransferase YhbS